MGQAEDEALIKAAKSGDEAAVRAALGRGANVECTDATVRLRRDDCAAAPAALRPRRRVPRSAGPRALLSAPPRAVRAKPLAPLRCLGAAAQFGKTPLSWAAGEGRLGVVQLLFERGANVHAKATVRARVGGHFGTTRAAAAAAPARYKRVLRDILSHSVSRRLAGCAKRPYRLPYAC
jgi:hypothetical protein